MLSRRSRLESSNQHGQQRRSLSFSYHITRELPARSTEARRARFTRE